MESIPIAMDPTKWREKIILLADVHPGNFHMDTKNAYFGKVSPLK